MPRARKQSAPDVCARSARAFAELVRDHERKLYRLALRITGTAEDAEDVVQEALLRAYQHLPEFQGNSTLYTWICRIVLNEGYRRRRNRGGEQQISLDERDGKGAAQLAVESTDPERAAYEQQLRSLLARAVHSMPRTYRALFIACVREGRPVEEVAAGAALPVAVVRQRLVRARLWLRETLLPCSRWCKHYRSECVTHPCEVAGRACLQKRSRSQAAPK